MGPRHFGAVSFERGKPNHRPDTHTLHVIAAMGESISAYFCSENPMNLTVACGSGVVYNVPMACGCR